MSQTLAKMAIKETQRFMLADSTLELRIHDINNMGSEISSDKVLLMEGGDAFWSLKWRHKNLQGHYEKNHCELFDVSIIGFPQELKAGARLKFHVHHELDHERVNDTLYFNDDKVGPKVSSVVLISSEFKEIGNLLNNISTFSVLTEIFEEKRNFENDVKFFINVKIDCLKTAALSAKFHDPVVASKTILTNVSKIYNDSIFSDFTFIVQNQEFKVHKCILASASSVMHKMFTSNLEETRNNQCVIQAITPDVFGQLIEFIYSGKVAENLKTTAKKLYEAAHYYEIEHLKVICAREIHDGLMSANALEIYKWAEPYTMNEVKQAAWEIIKREILKIYVPMKKEPFSIPEIFRYLELKKIEQEMLQDFKK